MVIVIILVIIQHCLLTKRIIYNIVYQKVREIFNLSYYFATIAQEVERNIGNVEVTGSTPVSSSDNI